MSLNRYGVLVGKAIDVKLGSGSSPHYQVLTVDDDVKYRISINVKSKAFPSELLYLIDESFNHPVTDLIADKPFGFHEVDSGADGESLDFIRGNLFDPAHMVALAHDIPGPDNDLNEKIDFHIRRAIADETAVVYAFGERWGPESNKSDRYFGFRPGNGIHDIHMNQGNLPQWQGDDGVWQDGGLLIHFPTNNQWVGIFLAFQSQSWHTDDQTGHTIAGPGDEHFPPVIPDDPDEPRPLPQATGHIRIIAALVNPKGNEPGHEIVYLLNITSQDIDLAGWSIKDKLKRSESLDGESIEARGLLKVTLSGQTAALSNKGGLITLIDAQGLKVDGVSYTKEQARRKEDWLVTFSK
ncbi:MAG: DUF2278 family protein [Halopseudomonas sp.]